MTAQFDPEQLSYGAFDPRSKPTAPTAVAAAPPMSSHMVLSVGLPVKNREKPEAVESEALMPKMMRIMPPTSNTSEMGLFMIFERLA